MHVSGEESLLCPKQDRTFALPATFFVFSFFGAMIAEYVVKVVMLTMKKMRTYCWIEWRWRMQFHRDVVEDVGHV